MIYLRKNSKMFIIIMIYLVSFAVGINGSGILSSFSNDPPDLNDYEILEKFDNLKNEKKVIVEINSTDLEQSITEIEEIIDLFSATIIISERKGNHLVSLFEIPRIYSDEILTNLRTLDKYKSEKIITKMPGLEINIEERIQNYHLSKEHIKRVIAETSMPERLTLYYNQLSSIQNSLDSLVTMKKKNISLVKKDIVLLKVIELGNDKTPLLATVIELLKLSFYTIILVTLILVILYLFMVLMMYLMNKLGLKTAKSKIGYYGKYSNEKKKVKRIYKNTEEN